ncbi:MAG: nucleoside kinase, partial [Anaerolineae bacterium]|nr:nucleoside kinase [Anaerolineae bacterium]
VTAIPIDLRQSDGNRMYRRSLVLLLTTAANECFPGVKIAVEHSVPSGGFYCEPEDRPNFTRAELLQIKRRMEALVAEDVPIERKTIPLTEAIERFKASGDDDMVRLLEFRNKSYLTVYALRDSLDYFFGYMVPSTGYLSLFDLQLTSTGFILAFPHSQTPNRIQPYKESYKLEAVFRQTDQWLDVMGLEDVGRLNQSIEAGRIREEVLVAEALHLRHLAETARLIAQQHEQGVRLVLLAGPSSAGKTTTSKRLAVQLMAYGLQPYALGMDDYFVDRELTPRDDAGEFDFESLYALNLERFNKDLLALMQGAEVQLPRFDFKIGKSLDSSAIKLTNDHILIVEGIHGLNPELVSKIPPERIFRIYVSALTVLNLNRHNRIPTTDVRLLRRLVRDAAHRGYSAQDTLNRWSSVRRGEERNIFPYQENADVMFNSSLAYEVAVLRSFAEPLLRQVEIDSPRYIEARRLLAFLSWVRPASADYVPDDSLLREFIGGSILDTYVAGSRFL